MALSLNFLRLNLCDCVKSCGCQHRASMPRFRAIHQPLIFNCGSITGIVCFTPASIFNRCGAIRKTIASVDRPHKLNIAILRIRICDDQFTTRLMLHLWSTSFTRICPACNRMKFFFTYILSKYFIFVLCHCLFLLFPKIIYTDVNCISTIIERFSFVTVIYLSFFESCVLR